MAQGIVLFSGGLDSVVATHLLKSQGIKVLALHFVLPFYSGLGKNHALIRKFASILEVPLRIEEEGDEFLGMIKDPRFGFGKNANPCLDCRIHRLEKARKIMEETGAEFLATGEVVGQRPMSQRMECLHLVEDRAGLAGKLLRPLSAKLLMPTFPELSGLVNREKLWDHSGRSRRPQIAYAKEHGLQHTAPAGGCLLTHESSAVRFTDLVKYNPDFSVLDFKLLAYGRHFRIDPKCKLIIARNEKEAEIFDTLTEPNLWRFEMASILGPLALMNAPEDISDEHLYKAASFMARFSRLRDESDAGVRIIRGDMERVICVKPESLDNMEAFRV